MATHMFSSYQMIDSLSNYLSWAGGIQQSLINIGLKRTNDTGQTDFVSLSFTITGTQLTSNVATYTCVTTAGMRIGQSLVISGLPSDGAVYNRTATVTAMTGTTFNVAITNANIAYTDNAGTAAGAIATGVPAALTHHYQIWRFDDALQSTTPVYIKLCFGMMTVTSYTNYQLGPYFCVQVGTGSNGSGSLTSAYTLGTSQQTYPLTSTDRMQCTTLTDSYVSGDTNRLSMLLWRTSDWSKMFSIERTKNSLGEDTDVGVQSTWCYVYKVQTSGTVNQYFRGFDFCTPVGSHYTSDVIPCIGVNRSSTLYGPNMTVFPLFSPFGGIQYPMLSCMSGCYADFTECVDFQYSIYEGLEVNYKPFTYAAGSGSIRGFGGGTQGAFLMRWE